MVLCGQGTWYSRYMVHVPWMYMGGHGAVWTWSSSSRVLEEERRRALWEEEGRVLARP